MRAVLHVDMDAFFAAVEQRDVPELAERPVVIGGDPSEGRGVVSTCNYPAREYGVHSAMPVVEAQRRCPDAVFLTPDHDKYRQASQEVMAFLSTRAHRMDQLSIDEAYLELEVDGFREAVEEAVAVRDAVSERFDLTCSVGVSDSCTTAKIASDRNKPDGLTVVPPDDVEGFLGALPVGRIPGVGDSTQERLRREGMTSIADVQAVSPDRMQDLLGSHGTGIHQKALGRHERTIGEPSERKSIGTEHTFREDIRGIDRLRERASRLTGKVVDRASEKGYRFSTVEIKLRTADFDTMTRQVTGDVPVQDEDVARDRVHALLGAVHEEGRAYRLLGVRVSGLQAAVMRQTTIDEFA